MLVLISCLFFVQTVLSSENLTAPIIVQHADETSLECYYQIAGQIHGTDYDDGHKEVTPCEPSVQYCQKVSARFIDTEGNTNIIMRGCDAVTIPHVFDGIGCNKNGCFEQYYDNEYYTVCCCDSNMCNPSPPLKFLLFSVTALLASLY